MTDTLNFSDKRKNIFKTQIYITIIYVAKLNANISYTKIQSQHRNNQLNRKINKEVEDWNWETIFTDNIRLYCNVNVDL